MELHDEAHTVSIQPLNKALSAAITQQSHTHHISNLSFQQAAHMLSPVITQLDNIRSNPVIRTQENKVHPSNSATSTQTPAGHSANNSP